MKRRDYGFFFTIGRYRKNMVIDRGVKMKITSVAELQHYADNAKKSKEEIAAIIETEKEVGVTAKGIVAAH